MRAVVAERGQVTIPKALRQRLGITPSTVLEFSEERGRLVAVKANPADPVERALGCLKTTKGTNRILEELRGRP